MDINKVLYMFEKYNKKYFYGKLYKVRVSWSPRMTLCAGKTAYKVWKRGGTSCDIRLSQPLLSQRPLNDTVNTLLHEMIHAYLHITQGLNYRDSHGSEFKSHMKRINDLEGSKITIYHNFEKEVNKYRVNIYRCDGPCVSRRPFYGILRRAIERPPGPEDKWWARHQSECGGTFHKIEGEEAISTSNKSLGMYSQRKQNNKVPKVNSQRKQNNKVPEMNTQRNQNGNVPNKSHEPLQNLLHKNINDDKKRKAMLILKKKQESNLGTAMAGSSRNKEEMLDEGALVERIQKKYLNVKQTIMLSKEASLELGKNVSHRSVYRYPAAFGNYVKGNVNYNYQSHSPSQIKLSKYLMRYKEAQKILKPTSSESKKPSENLCLSKSSKELQMSKLSKEPKVSKSFKEPLMSKSSKNPKQRRDRRPVYPYPAPFGNYVKGKINYNYQSHSPSQIKLHKYLRRYREAQNLLESTFSESEKSLRFHQQKPNELVPVSAGPIKDMLSIPGTSKTTVCPVCNIKIPVGNYAQHLGECFAVDDDFGLDFEECGNVPIVTLDSTPPRHVSQKATNSSSDDSAAATNCLNCGSKVLMAEMKLHLQYCVDSDDATDFEDSPLKSASQGSEDGGKIKADNVLDSQFVCPTCTERVKESDIQKHLDACLEFLCDEF